jgi:hypothetical protein
MIVLLVVASLPSGVLAAPGGSKGNQDDTKTLSSWSEKLPADDGEADGCNSSRFRCVLDGEAVLDMETGIVWERVPEAVHVTWYDAQLSCDRKRVGGRMGWRLPTLKETRSLIDPNRYGLPNRNCYENDLFPTGHPFINVTTARYWTATPAYVDPTYCPSTVDVCVETVYFYDGSSDLGTGRCTASKGYRSKLDSLPYWCVRGRE